MLVFLVRHAHAEPGDPDETRPLSERGRSEARALAKSLSNHPTPPVTVVTSPLLRARQTADAIAAATGAVLRVDARLAPGTTLERLREATGNEARPLVAVCHQPDCSEIALALDGSRPGLPSRRSRRAHARRVSTTSAISVRDLTKSYGGVEALRGISFEVATGEVFGSARAERRGQDHHRRDPRGVPSPRRRIASVLGFDPNEAPRGFRERIGVVLQHSEQSPLLTVREAHRMFAGYYAQPRNVDEVIELVGLTDKRDARVSTLSGGQKRRLDLGIALVGDPELVFLDEPTTGFDPAARRSAWEMIRSLRALGKTILLTTHYLDEAQQLADRVAVIRAGLIVAQEPPRSSSAALAGRRSVTGSTASSSCSRPTTRPGCCTSSPARRSPKDARSSSSRCDGPRSRTSTSSSSPRSPTRRRKRREDPRASARFEQRLFWRSREAAVFIFIFPILLYALLVSVYSDDIDGVPSADVLLAGLFGYAAANTAFAGLAIILVGRREAGILKRLRSTPLPPATYIAAVLLSTLVVFALETVALLALGMFVFGASAPANALGFAGAVVLGVACFAGLGVGAAALIRSAEGVSAVVNVIVLPMAFLSGRSARAPSCRHS